ncbi:hypothetical protein HPB51_017843 [Rhipicephalus microplus]|uniref:Uncharacterized protein n=1 Tax=Rhipicephalus microplus TaxID=6941 RepID=A0A9J6E3A3_RHIMP|nr:hypothetical protein HPB51_017843 [Rhipicephalus microplus]
MLLRMCANERNRNGGLRFGTDGAPAPPRHPVEFLMTVRCGRAALARKCLHMFHDLCWASMPKRIPSVPDTQRCFRLIQGAAASQEGAGCHGRMWTVRLEGGPRRVNHAAVAINGKVYSFGGYCTGEDYNTRKPIDVHVLNTGKSFSAHSCLD